MTHTYTAGDFLKRLTEGALRTPLLCEGFAKPVEGSHEAFLFSLGTSCKDWIKIPGEVIEKVEFLGERSCRDHSHPLIRIHFKEPSANEPFAVVFSSLLRASNPEPINQHMLMLALTEDEQIPRLSVNGWHVWALTPSGTAGRLGAAVGIAQSTFSRGDYASS
jgi:hypothetical protein